MLGFQGFMSFLTLIGCKDTKKNAHLCKNKELFELKNDNLVLWEFSSHKSDDDD